MNLPLRPEVEEAFGAALEVADAEQAAFLVRQYPGDPELRAEVESLLAAHRAAGSFMELRPCDGVRPGATAAEGPADMPATVGRYRIIRLLGEGGMGAVYEAEQDHPRRIVALKVIKAGYATPELLRRFEQESQALGRLQHPGIAQIYEAGTADSGFGPQPYFSMEFIRGVSLLPHAESRQLTTRARLELMAEICEAVQHAHQRGIIHRDLKPGNILVDESGQPKILDFGVARVTDSDTHSTRQTDVGRLVGTLAYMSPEQVLADPLELDTRSDVYALGVIMFEMLAGRPPYKIGRQPHEAVRIIREQDPESLSSVNRAYRGDIETIAAKALEKDKARRYGSAAELAADIRRYLRDEAIVARRPSSAYHLQKFARRHRPLVAGVGSVFAVLVAGVIVSTWEAARARQSSQAALRERDRAALAERAATVERNRALTAERAATSERNRAVAEEQRADTESATARAINSFLENDLLAQASASVQAGPGTKPDPDLKVRTALERAASDIAGKFENQPLVEASIRETIGNAYKDLGLYRDAQLQLERALELRRGYTPEDPKALRGMNDLALVYLRQGKYAQAEPLLTKVLEVRRRTLGPEHPDTLSSLDDLSELYWRLGKYAQAEPLVVRVLSARRRLLGLEHRQTLEVEGNLAQLYQYQHKNAQAEPLFLKVLEVRRRTLGDEHPDTLVSSNNLAVLYLAEGKYTQAEPLFTQVLEGQRRVLGEEHPYTLISINNLGVLYRDSGSFTKAEPLLTKVLEVRRRVLGPEHPDTLISMSNLGILYQKQGKAADAEAVYTRIVEVRRRILGSENRATTNAMVLLSKLWMSQQRYAEAEPLLREAVNGKKKTAPDTWERYDSQSALGAILVAQQNFTDAEPLLLEGYQWLADHRAAIPWESRSEPEEVGQSIERLYQNWGKAQQAAVWRGKLEASARP